MYEEVSGSFRDLDGEDTTELGGDAFGERKDSHYSIYEPEIDEYRPMDDPEATTRTSWTSLRATNSPWVSQRGGRPLHCINYSHLVVESKELNEARKGWEYYKGKVTEISVSILDPTRITDGSSLWAILKAMVTHHVRIKHNAHLVNGDLCPGKPDIGTTAIVNTQESSRRRSHLVHRATQLNATTPRATLPTNLSQLYTCIYHTVTPSPTCSFNVSETSSKRKLEEAARVGAVAGHSVCELA